MAAKASSVRKPAEGVKEIRLSMTATSSFDSIVKTLKEVLTLPEIGNFRGCRPCLSGLDRIILEDPAFRTGLR